MKKVAALFVCLLVCFVSSCSCGYDNDYFLEANWDCDNETFLSYYDNLYAEKLQELKTKYNIECEENKEVENNDSDGAEIIHYLYNEEFTMIFYLSSDNTYSSIRSELYYYGKETLTQNYSDVQNIVGIYNEFINYVSYDAKTDVNHFDKLYGEALNNDDLFASENLHHDDTVGTLGYTVYLNYTDGGYYYMMEKNNSFEKESHWFKFKGLLKPIES